MIAFLPPISAITRLRWRWPGTTLAACSRICRPTAQEPVKTSVWMRGSATSALPASSPPGSRRERVERDAAGVQGVDDGLGARGRLLGGLEHDRVAGRQRGADHARGDRQREVPRRDHAGHAAADVAHRVALARQLDQRLAAVERERALRVVLEEVDRLADVAVGLGPGLAGLADGERGELQAARAQDAGGARERGGAIGGGLARPGLVALLGAADGVLDVRCGGLVRVGDDAGGRARVDGGEDAAGDDVLPDQHRDLERQLGVERVQRGQRLAADGLAAQLEQRFVHKGHGASRSSAVSVPLACGGEEGVVGGVLEQAAHEVGHAGDEVADRAVGAHAAAGRGDRGLRVVAQAAQDLELEVLGAHVARVGVGGGVRDRAQVVRRDRHLDQRRGVDQALGEQLEVAVALAAVHEHRRRPAVLGGLDDLVVPVGALDQADRERVPARGRGRPLQQLVEVLRGLGQVGLQDDAGGRALRRTRARRAGRA